MSVIVDISSDGVRAPIGREAAGDVVRAVLRSERVRQALLSVTFVSRRRIAALNRRHLGHHGPTDVISFAFTRSRADDPVIGDVYIAPEVARGNAVERGVPVRHEVIRLLVHGTLHVLGYDHPEGMTASRERSPMWRRQERLVKRLALSGTPR